jgi:acyl-CoA dehydrogenase
MDFSLSNEQRSWQVTARKFADEEIKPITLKLDEAPDAHGTFDWDVIEKGSKLGFRTMAVAKEYGGEGTDYVTQALVMAELARGDSSISKTFSQNWKWSHLIQQACNQEQKDRFLRPFVSDHRYLLGKGITEPTAGSDNRMPPNDAPKAGLKLRAERQGDDWILNGEKCFIANAPVGKLFFIDARTDPNAPLRQGTTMFLVPYDTPGFRIGKVFNKSGWRFYRNGEMIFENARVPHANVVGHVNNSDMKTQAAGDRTGGDLFGDLELAANALGVCDDACEQAMKHARTARQGGSPLIDQQHIALKLNKMNMLTEALRSYVMRIAWEHDHKIHSANAGLAMNFSTDVIQEVTEINLDIHGGAGGSLGARHAEKLVRDSFIWSHLAGDSVQRLKVAQRLERMAAAGH